MTALAPALQAFFTDRLIAWRHASGHTIAGYAASSGYSSDSPPPRRARRRPRWTSPTWTRR
jgi:hypothetical protein